jgi:hypothetical protein
MSEATWQTEDSSRFLRPHISHMAQSASIGASGFSSERRTVVSGHATIRARQDFSGGVKGGVEDSRCQFKIRSAVVCFVAVLVMYQFVASQTASDALFHYDAMFTPAVVITEALGGQNYIAFSVDCFPAFEVGVIRSRPRHEFPMQASATVDAALAHGFARHNLLRPRTRIHSARSYPGWSRCDGSGTRPEAVPRPLHGQRHHGRSLHPHGPQIHRDRERAQVFRHCREAHRGGVKARAATGSRAANHPKSIARSRTECS